MPRYARAPSALATELPDGDVVMMDIDLATYFGLEGVAAEIWRLLDTPKSRDELVDVLVSSFDVAPDVCRNETDAFLESLLERDLIIVSD